MLCRRSAILIRMTRTSSESVRSTLRKYSACSEVSALKTPDILVSPSTIEAIFGPKIRSMSSTVYSVSSTTSCSRAATTDFTPSPISSMTILATAMGWRRYGSPERRRTPSCASLARKNARLMKFQSSSFLQIFVHESNRSSHFSLIRASSSAVYPIGLFDYSSFLFFMASRTFCSISAASASSFLSSSFTASRPCPIFLSP